MSAYSPQPLSPTTIQRLQAGLRAAVDSDQALTADTRVIDVSWRDITSDPIPGEGDDGGDSPTLAPASAPSGNVIPIVRETKRDTGLETWAIALIATASTLCLCMAYLCLRRGKHEPIFDSVEDDMDAQGDDSASSDHFSNERTKSKERTPLVAAAPVGNEPPSGGNQVVQSTTPYRDPFSVSSGPSSGSDGAGKVQGRGGSPNQMEDASSSGSGGSRSGSGSRSEAESSRSESGSQFEDEYGYENNGPPKNQSIQQAGNRNNSSRETRSSPKPGGEVFSAEYSEVEVEEEYEVEYVDDDEDHDDEGSAEYDDEYDDNYDDDDYEEDSYADDPDGIVVDAPGPGGTPILPWLARDD